MYNNNSYVETVNFGYVPVRKTHTDGKHLQDIMLSSNGTNECFAEIREDYWSKQPFAVLYDEEWNLIK